MLKLVADVNMEGQLKSLLGILKRSEWHEILELQDVLLLTFDDLGLSKDADDQTVWHTVQSQNAILFTGNRNRKGAKSLQATIESFNDLNCLPVITISDVQRINTDRAYALRCANKVMDYLVDMENYRGTGRLYIP